MRTAFDSTLALGDAVGGAQRRSIDSESLSRAGRGRSADIHRATFCACATFDDLHRDRDLSTCQAARAPPRDKPGRPRAQTKPTMRAGYGLTHSVPALWSAASHSRSVSAGQYTVSPSASQCGRLAERYPRMVRQKDAR